MIVEIALDGNLINTDYEIAQNVYDTSYKRNNWLHNSHQKEFPQ